MVKRWIRPSPTRTRNLRVMLSRDEQKQLRALATSLEVSCSEYVRGLIQREFKNLEKKEPSC